MLLDPTDDFINAHLEEVIEGEQNGRKPRGCLLFNIEIGDGHFSPLGSETWAATVGRRLVLLLESDRQMRWRGTDSRRRPLSPAEETASCQGRRDVSREPSGESRRTGRRERVERGSPTLVEDTRGAPSIAMGPGDRSDRAAPAGTPALFPFVERARRLDRIFKVVMAVLTLGRSSSCSRRCRRAVTWPTGWRHADDG